MLKRIILFTLVQEILIFIMMWLKGSKFSLLSYTNVSFFLGFLFFLSALTIFTARSGFLDQIHSSLRKMTRQNNENEYSNMRLSELITFSYIEILVSSLTVLLLSVISLVIYSL